MAKLPARRKISVLVYRRSGPDSILVVQREVKRAMRPVLPSDELQEGEAPRDAALRVTAALVNVTPLSDIDVGVHAEYRVNSGPRAGEWSEVFHAVEVPADARARRGAEWWTHYDAKAQAGEDAPRVREAISRLREMARLKP